MRRVCWLVVTLESRFLRRESDRLLIYIYISLPLQFGVLLVTYVSLQCLLYEGIELNVNSPGCNAADP